MLGLVALTAPVAAQPFTYGQTEVHPGYVNFDSLDDYQSPVVLCRAELDQIETDGDILNPDLTIEGEVGTYEDGRPSRTDTHTWTRGDANTAAGECKFVMVSHLYGEDFGGTLGWIVLSGVLTITKSWVMPDLSAAASPVYTYVDADGNALAGNFTVPEGNCDDDESSDTGTTRFDDYDPNTETDHLQIRPGDLYGIKLNSRPSSSVWITVLGGTDAGDDHDLWSPSSTTWTISSTDYDRGRTTRWIRVCAYPDDDSGNGTRTFHHLLNSNDKTFLGTTTLTVEEVDDD